MRLRIRARGKRPDLAVGPGERLLAHATGPGGVVVGGTRDALYLPQRVPWETVATADWDQDEEVLHVVELAAWGQPQPEHRLALTEPGRLIELVRPPGSWSTTRRWTRPTRGSARWSAPPSRPRAPTWGSSPPRGPVDFFPADRACYSFAARRVHHGPFGIAIPP